jgi:hypothetical protein
MSGVNFKTETNGHTLFSNNNYSVSMHHNFHSVVAMKIKTTGRPRERNKDNTM